MKRLRMGIVGVGERGCYVLGSRIVELSKELDLEITALCDTNPERIIDAHAHIKALCEGRGLSWGRNLAEFPDYRDLIDSPLVDAILITTHTDQHMDPAIYALASGKHVYLDKPIAISTVESRKILEAESRYDNRLIMGFTRRYEKSWRTARDLLVSGAIGALQLMQIRSVIPYTRYLQMWHRRNSWSGGALNDKSSHHFDALNWIADSACVRISAIGGRSDIFKPREDAPLSCSLCDDSRCPYRRSANPDDTKEGTQVLGLPSWRDARGERDRGDTCVYLPGADIIDHAICMIQYGNGVKASLLWAIYGPHADDQETLELIGSRGRIVLTRATGQVVLHTIGDGPGNERTETIDARGSDFGNTHFGADVQLVKDIRKFCDLADAHEPFDAMNIARAADGHASLMMIEAVLGSIAADGMPVALEPMRQARKPERKPE